MNNWFSRSMGDNKGWQGDEAVPAGEIDEDVFKALEEVTLQIDKIKNPTGAQDSPGRTCEDLKNHNPDIQDGYYWINPNLGPIYDVMKVRCDFRKKKVFTCVQPEVKTIENLNVAQKDSHTWISEVLGNRINYDPAKFVKPQIKFLQYLHQKANQEIVYKCKNSVAIDDNDEDKSIQLTGFDDSVLSSKGKRSIRYKIKKDNCKSKNGSWGKTVLEVNTKRTKALPIMDIGVLDIGAADQDFKIEIGEVCFFN